MFHIANRYGYSYRRDIGVPAVGSIRSWHAITWAAPEQAKSARTKIQLALNEMAALIFPSRHALAEGEALGFEYSCPAVAVPNGIDAFWLDGKASRKRRGIIYAGSLEKRKRPDAAIVAAASLKMPLVLLGDGDIGYVADLKALAAQIGCDATFKGTVDRTAVRAEFGNASLVCVPSASESFGNVYLEAAACGAPCVGFGPTLAEISAHLGFEIGIPLPENATDEDVTVACQAALDMRLDADEIRSSIADRALMRHMTARYVEVIRGIL